MRPSAAVRSARRRANSCLIPEVSSAPSPTVKPSACSEVYAAGRRRRCPAFDRFALPRSIERPAACGGEPMATALEGRAARAIESRNDLGPDRLRYLALNDLANDGNLHPRLSREYVCVVSDQRTKREAIRAVTRKRARRLEGRLITAPRLRIRRSQVRSLPGAPRYQPAHHRRATASRGSTLSNSSTSPVSRFTRGAQPPRR